MARKTNTRQSAARRDIPARRELQAEFALERRLTKLSSEGQRKICAVVVGFWLLERPQHLEQVRQWVFEE